MFFNIINVIYGIIYGILNQINILLESIKKKVIDCNQILDLDLIFINIKFIFKKLY